MSDARERPASSVWLMASAEDEALLRGVVEDLAQRRGGPLFQPHLTLMGDLPYAAEALAGRLGAIAAGAEPFAAPIAGLETTAAYFRAFYAAFRTTPQLAALRAAAARATGGAEGDFLPHVSLFYGQADAAAVGEDRARLAADLLGRPIRFERVVAVSSSQFIPIPEWRIVASATLGSGAS